MSSDCHEPGGTQVTASHSRILYSASIFTLSMLSIPFLSIHIKHTELLSNTHFHHACGDRNASHEQRLP